MEVLGITYWSIVLVAVLLFMPFIKPFADTVCPVPGKKKKEKKGYKPSWLCEEEEE